MPVSVDWGSKVISVPQDYLTFVSGTTYQMDVDDFRLQLKDLEDDLAGGIAYPDTHRHTAPVVLSGTTYSRFVEIINDYTITFEDGLYQVNLSGANNNIVDVLNRNSVSVVANNSSGLISLPEIQFSSYQDRITVDPINGASGTDFPYGTSSNPVNNITDALTISNATGINKIFFKSSYTITDGSDVSFKELEGDSPARVTLSFEDGSNTTGTELFNCQVQGYIGAIAGATACHLLDIIGTSNASDVEINLHDCIIEDTITLSSGLTGEIQVFNCKSGLAVNTPVFDLNGAGINLVTRDFTGGIQINNFSGGGNASMDFLSGQLIIDSSCTDATLTVRGLSKITNNASANPNLTLIDETHITTVQIDQIAGAVWNKLVTSHVTDGTFGQHVGRKLLTTGKFIALK